MIGVKIRIKCIDDQIIKDLFPPCNACIYWEAPKELNAIKKSDIEKNRVIEMKQDWFKETQGVFGCCGKILYVDGEPVAYSQYTLPDLFENAREYSQHLFPVSGDGVLISCLYVKEGYRGRGLGTRLLRSVLKDLRKRGYEAVETYTRDDSPNNCSGPTVFYLRNGFTKLKTKKWGETRFSLVRVELKNIENIFLRSENLTCSS